jgi:hypothetical protein
LNGVLDWHLQLEYLDGFAGQFIKTRGKRKNKAFILKVGNQLKTFEKVVAAIFLYLVIQMLVLLLVLGCHYLYIKDMVFVPIWVAGVLTWILCLKLFNKS